MGWERMPLGAYMTKGRSTQAYQELWQEILTLIE